MREILPVTIDAAGRITSLADDYNAGTVRLTGLRERNFRRGDPLSFTQAFNPRQILWGLKLVF